MKTRIRTIPDLPGKSLLAALLVAAMLVLPVPQAHSDSGISWQSLSKDEQSVLAKHRSSWSSLSPGQQRRLRNGAQQYLQLSPDERRAVERKHNQYEKMSPKEREKLREKYSRQKAPR